MIKKAKIVTITSVKGGTGKSINTLNIAGAYSKMNKNVLVIDLDLYSSDLAAMLDIDPKMDLYTLFEDISNNSFKSIEDYISKYNDNIDVLCSPKDPRYAGKINSNLINLLLYKVKNKYDVILIDSSYILNEINLVMMDYSDYLVYIVNNSPMDIKNMKTMVSILQDMNKDNFKIVLYDAKDKNKKLFSKFDIRNIVKENLSYYIPESFYLKNIDEYIMNGKVLTIDEGINKYHHKVMDTYDKLANDLLK